MISTSEQAGDIAERVTRILRLIRPVHVHDWDTSGRHRPPCCTTCGDRQKD
jgi:hypothetical protein